MKKIVNAIIYARKSIERKKDNKERSTQVQCLRCKTRIELDEQKEGITINLVAELIDDNLSGYDAYRPSYEKMLKLCKTSSIDRIYVSEFSRITRKLSEGAQFRDFIIERKINAISLYEGYDIRTDYGLMLFAQSCAKNESDVLVAKNRAKQHSITSLIEFGKINGAKSILGLVPSIDKGHFDIDESEVTVLTKLLEIYLTSTSKVDTLRIATSRGLYDQGNKPFRISRFNNILKNVMWRYAGKWYLKNEETGEVIREVKLPHGEVLPSDLRMKVLNKLKSKSISDSKYGRHNYIYLLSGILLNQFENRYHGKIAHGKDKSYRYYYDPETKHNVLSDELEKLIITRVKSYLFNSKILKNIMKEKVLNQKTLISLQHEKLRSVRKEIARVDEEIHNIRLNLRSASNENMVNLLSDDLDTLTSSKVKLTLDEVKYKDLLKSLQVEPTLDEIETKIKDFLSRLDQLDRKERRSFIRSIFSKIVVVSEYRIKLVFNENSISGNVMEETIEYKQERLSDDIEYLKKLYIEKNLSLRVISKKVGISRNTVRKRLVDAGVVITESDVETDKSLSKKIKTMVEKEKSYAEIARLFNLWKVPTRSRVGKWYPKTVRDIALNL